MEVFRKFYKVKGYCQLYDWSVRMRYMVTKKAIWRAKVVTFFNKYGLKATEEAFGVKKSSIYKWKKLLKENQAKTASESTIGRIITKKDLFFSLHMFLQEQK